MPNIFIPPTQTVCRTTSTAKNNNESDSYVESVPLGYDVRIHSCFRSVTLRESNTRFVRHSRHRNIEEGHDHLHFRRK